MRRIGVILVLLWLAGCSSSPERPRISDPDFAATGAGSENFFLVPLRAGYQVSSPFGPRGRSVHKGLDLRVPVGTPVQAARDGVVVSAESWRGYGLVVILRHGDGWTSRYAHLNGFEVRPGEQVLAGQVIATSGQSGNATGPHLHFEIRQNGVPVDPVAFLQF